LKLDHDGEAILQIAHHRGWQAAVEEVVTQKISKNTRPVFVAITSPRRAFFQFFSSQPRSTTAGLAGLAGESFYQQAKLLT
jgi:hypothetical protein